MPAEDNVVQTSGALLAVPLLFAAVLGAAPPAAAAPVTDPAAAVDPFIGTGSGGPVIGDVDAFPGATAPFGMVQWSPDTPGRPSGGGYRYTDHDITGFSLTHLSGVGCPSGGDFPFLPLAGALPADPGTASLPFTHTDESAAPGSGHVFRAADRIPHGGGAEE
jgi:putative alpha-1,2-mannosidase